MRTYLAAAIALGVAVGAQAIPARAADVNIGPNGVTISPGPHDYWRSESTHDAWRRREEWREAQSEEWRHNHCVRDWRDEVYCR